MRRLILFVLGLTAALVFVPSAAVADSAPHSYVLVMEEPNFGVAPNGDQIAISGGNNMSAPLLARALGGDIFFAFIAAIALGRTLPAGSDPALYTSTAEPPMARANASAIWLRHELPVHSIRILDLILKFQKRTRR